jgi:hypothetical protein
VTCDVPCLRLCAAAAGRKVNVARPRRRRLCRLSRHEVIAGGRTAVAVSALASRGDRKGGRTAVAVSALASRGDRKEDERRWLSRRGTPRPSSASGLRALSRPTRDREYTAGCFIGAASAHSVTSDQRKEQPATTCPRPPACGRGGGPPRRAPPPRHPRSPRGRPTPGSEQTIHTYTMHVTSAGGTGSTVTAQSASSSTPSMVPGSRQWQEYWPGSHAPISPGPGTHAKSGATSASTCAAASSGTQAKTSSQNVPTWMGSPALHGCARNGPTTHCTVRAGSHEMAASMTSPSGLAHPPTQPRRRTERRDRRNDMSQRVAPRDFSRGTTPAVSGMCAWSRGTGGR